jgi:hypothetical protein
LLRTISNLDEFENLNADFTNYYRWTGGQEMFDRYKVVTVDFDSNQANVAGFLYNIPGSDGIQNYESKVKVTCIKQKNQWQILSID